MSECCPWLRRKITRCVWQGTAGGEAIQFGASRDRQTAADTAALSGNVSTGAATFAFIQARTNTTFRCQKEAPLRLAHTVMLSHAAT
jgi:hypothetical protein